MLKKKTISVTEEKRIVLGLIVSTEFFKSIQDTLKLSYFKNSYLKIVASWCEVYFEQYNKAPYLHIQDVFDAESSELKETDSELIEKLISSLSEQYDSENINVQYLSEMALDYFRQREVEILINNITILKEDGDLEGAEEALENFKKVTTAIDYSVIINPGNLEQQEEIYTQRETQDKHFFQFPGDLGKYLGNHKRGDVVGYYGPAKRGKCASGDNLIYLADGTIRTLKEVVNKKIQNILCMDKNQKIVKGKVTNWIESGHKKEYIITTKTGVETKVSKDHKYYTPSGWKKASELTTTDFIATCRKTHNLQKFKVDDRETKLLAYLIADGHLGPTRISFTKLETVVMYEFLQSVDYFNDTYRFDKAGKEITIHVGQITKLLKKANLFGKLSGEKFIPNFILQSSNRTLNLFLNRLFTCDGSIYKDRNNIIIEYSTKSKQLAQQIIGALKRFGILGLLRKVKVGGTVYYSILLSSNYNIELFMKKIGFSFNKQKVALDLCKNLKSVRDYVDVIPPEFVQEVGNKLKQKGKSVSSNETFRVAYTKNKHLSRFTFNKIAQGKHKQLHNDLVWVKITAIRKMKKKVQMYDLTVEKNHNFIMNSCIVHNSFTLINNFKHGVIQKRKTLFWSIEMTKTEVLPRVNKAFFPMINDDSGYYTYPAFDCIHNQTGDCRKRNSPVAVLDGDEMIPDPHHIVCTKCMRHRKARVRKKYRMTVYQKKTFRETDDIFAVREQHKSFKRLWDTYGRISVHKKYSLTYDTMMRDLDALVNKENFIPDILIIDYIDILITNSNFDDYRLDDEKWKLLAKIAGEMNVLVITGTQANKAGHTTDILSAEHQGGYYGKNRHVNLMVGLNQKPEEKELGLMRFGITEAREIEFIPGRTCAVLQDFKTGQAYLDSYYK